MGEIECEYCGYMTNHLAFHYANDKRCVVCSNPIGKYCKLCNEFTCQSCHNPIYEHIEYVIEYHKEPLANIYYQDALYLECLH